MKMKFSYSPKSGKALALNPSCSTCKYQKSMNVKTIKERTDNGGIHFKYLYEWMVDCEKEGEMIEIIEGTRDRTPLPTCSLWRSKSG